MACALSVVVPLALACADDPASTTAGAVTPPPFEATSTPASLPPPVTVSPEPQGVSLQEPSFEALDGARAYHGRLGGAVYRIEVPDEWNGRLVLYMHGFQGLAPEASVETPASRGYLIRNGYAWGASSYSSTALIPGRAADETAALWDYFSRTFGRPARTYVTGNSMGGAATHIAAERYADRFDGALGICGFAGQTAQAQIVTDWFFAGAYAAGVTQEEFDESTDINSLIFNRIVPALEEPLRREAFEQILVGMTGGPRAFDRMGIRAEELTNWTRAAILIPFRLGTNGDRQYALAPGNVISSADFNAGTIRVPQDDANMLNFVAGNEVTGELMMPMITLHTTGDWQVPIDQQQILRRAVDSKGQADLLVQRIIRDPYHCNVTAVEWETAFEDLVAWVEDGRKAEGEQVLVDDLRTAGGQFTLAPRLGLPEADEVAGAGDRVTLHGAITVDGAPANGRYFWFEVHRGGLRTACSFPSDAPANGKYRRVIAADTEVHGCGGPGAVILGAMFSDDAVRLSSPITWPESATELPVDLVFSSTSGVTAGFGTFIYGTVLDGEGVHLPPTARIDAYIGQTLCGLASLNPVEMDFSGTDRYGLIVAGPDAIPGCERNARIRLLVDGLEAPQTAINDGSNHNLDIIVGP
jgi:pimeloyl-ACP methyl ester carboxylesterase